MQSNKPIVIIGGGISGITVAVEAAEAGAQVVLVEREPYLGGRVFRMREYFPKLCPPQCGMEINFQRIRKNPAIRVISDAHVQSVSGDAGNFEVKLSIGPQFVNDNCTSCGECANVCPVETDDDYNYGMSKRKAAYMPHPMVYPARFAIDTAACKGRSCGKCAEVCKYNAIELDKSSAEETISAFAVVYATGWKPYDAHNMVKLGFGKAKNVISNVMMERLGAIDGPTGGKINRPSDGKEVQNIAFVQCAGSRDENHLAYCSSICCLASLKQATYVRQANPEAQVTIFYIDIRTPGRYEEFYKKVAADEKVTLIKGKVAKIVEDPASGDVVLTVEDILKGQKKEFRMDMAVLATGMQPSLNGEAKRLNVAVDTNGFIDQGKLPAGVFATGVAENPVDVNTSVMNSTGTVLKILQGIK